MLTTYSSDVVMHGRGVLTADPVIMCTGALGFVYGFSYDPFIT